MKRQEINGKTFVILSRRNLLALLAKLDGHPRNSACTIGGGTDAPNLFVVAEEDEVHYAHRTQDKGWPSMAAGPMHPDTEARLSEMSEQRRRT